MNWPRAALFTVSSLFGAVSCAPGSAEVAQSDIAAAQPPGTVNGQTELILLGTGGGPELWADRAGIASLVIVNGKHYLVDAGEGVSRQLVRAGLKAPDVDVVILTHLHDDHTAGLAGLMTLAYSLRAQAMKIIGPPRTEALVDATIASLAANAEIRKAENNLSTTPEGVFSTMDVDPGLIYSDESLRVFAVENTHYTVRGRVPQDPLARRNKSYSLRFETPDKVIAFTGDTGPSEAVQALADGADILVAEMVTESDLRKLPPAIAALVRLGHLSPAQVGELAVNANVATVVLSHIGIVSPSDLAEIRAQFSGRIVHGEDLSRF